MFTRGVFVCVCQAAMDFLVTVAVVMTLAVTVAVTVAISVAVAIAIPVPIAVVIPVTIAVVIDANTTWADRHARHVHLGKRAPHDS